MPYWIRQEEEFIVKSDSKECILAGLAITFGRWTFYPLTLSTALSSSLNIFIFLVYHLLMLCHLIDVFKMYVSLQLYLCIKTTMCIMELQSLCYGLNIHTCSCSVKRNLPHFHIGADCLYFHVGVLSWNNIKNKALSSYAAQNIILHPCAHFEWPLYKHTDESYPPFLNAPGDLSSSDDLTSLRLPGTP